MLKTIVGDSKVGRGQLISKGDLSVSNSSKKMNLKMLTFALAYWDRNFSFVFCEN